MTLNYKFNFSHNMDSKFKLICIDLLRSWCFSASLQNSLVSDYDAKSTPIDWTLSMHLHLLHLNSQIRCYYPIFFYLKKKRSPVS